MTLLRRLAHTDWLACWQHSLTDVVDLMLRDLASFAAGGTRYV